MPRVDLQKTYVLRRILNPMGTQDAIEFLLGKLKETKTNSDFFDSMNTYCLRGCDGNAMAGRGSGRPFHGLTCS